MDLQTPAEQLTGADAIRKRKPDEDLTTPPRKARRRLSLVVSKGADDADDLPVNLLPPSVDLVTSSSSKAKTVPPVVDDDDYKPVSQLPGLQGSKQNGRKLVIRRPQKAQESLVEVAARAAKGAAAAAAAVAATGQANAPPSLAAAQPSSPASSVSSSSSSSSSSHEAGQPPKVVQPGSSAVTDQTSTRPSCFLRSDDDIWPPDTRRRPLTSVQRRALRRLAYRYAAPLRDINADLAQASTNAAGMKDARPEKQALMELVTSLRSDDEKLAAEWRREVVTLQETRETWAAAASPPAVASTVVAEDVHGCVRKFFLVGTERYYATVKVKQATESETGDGSIDEIAKLKQYGGPMRDTKTLAQTDLSRLLVAARTKYCL